MSAPDLRGPRRGPPARRLAGAALALIAATVAVLALAAGDSRSADRRAPYPAAFPEGAGRAIAERACLFCHSPMLVTQQAKDSTGWEKSLATMRAWGAPMSPAEQDTLREYLLAHFGPRAAAR